MFALRDSEKLSQLDWHVEDVKNFVKLFMMKYCYIIHTLNYNYNPREPGAERCFAGGFRFVCPGKQTGGRAAKSGSSGDLLVLLPLQVQYSTTVYITAAALSTRTLWRKSQYTHTGTYTGNHSGTKSPPFQRLFIRFQISVY